MLLFSQQLIHNIDLDKTYQGSIKILFYSHLQYYSNFPFFFLKGKGKRAKVYLSNDRFDVSTLLNTIDRDMEMETRLTLVFTIALQTTRLMELFTCRQK